MKERTSLEDVKNIISRISEWNPEKVPGEIAREMLKPEGCTYIEPLTISLENTVYAKKPAVKRAVLKVIADNLISQNPPREGRKTIVFEKLFSFSDFINRDRKSNP